MRKPALEDLQKLKAQGWSIHKISVLYNMPRSVVFDLIGKAPSGPRATVKSLMEEVVELYKGGMTAKAVAAKMGVPASTLRHWLSEAGVHRSGSKESYAHKGERECF